MPRPINSRLQQWLYPDDPFNPAASISPTRAWLTPLLSDQAVGSNRRINSHLIAQRTQMGQDWEVRVRMVNQPMHTAGDFDHNWHEEIPVESGVVRVRMREPRHVSIHDDALTRTKCINYKAIFASELVTDGKPADTTVAAATDAAKRLIQEATDRMTVAATNSLFSGEVDPTQLSLGMYHELQDMLDAVARSKRSFWPGRKRVTEAPDVEAFIRYSAHDYAEQADRAVVDRAIQAFHNFNKGEQIVFKEPPKPVLLEGQGEW